MNPTRSTPIPTRKELRYVHPASLITFSSLILPRTKSWQKYRLLMKQNLWTQSWNNDDTDTRGVSYRHTFAPFPINLRVESNDDRNNTSDIAYLYETNGKIVGVLERHRNDFDQTYRIFGLHPYVQGQTNSIPFDDTQEDLDLFLWAEVTLSTVFLTQFKMKMVDGVIYMADSFGPFWGCRNMRLLRNGLVCAIMSESQHHSPADDGMWSITIGPGVDPCLVIALMAIVDRSMIDRKKMRLMSYDRPKRSFSGSNLSCRKSICRTQR